MDSYRAIQRLSAAARLSNRAPTERTIVFRSLSSSQSSPRMSTFPRASSRVAGRVDQAGGIAVRVIDADNYYVVRANALEDNVRFYRVVKGRREQIDGANTKVASNEWHTLGLKAQDERFTVEFDGKTLFTAADKTFAGAGKVALWTKSDSVTRFDQIAVDLLP